MSKQATLSGPMFEPAQHGSHRSVLDKCGGHYNIFHFDDDGTGRVCPDAGLAALRTMFPDGQANELNLCLFSTSGIHGCYTTIEEVEAGLRKYGDSPDFDEVGDDWPEDWRGNTVTALIVHPRTVCLRYGNITVKLEDLEWLKKLRATSAEQFSKIGQPDMEQD